MPTAATITTLAGALKRRYDDKFTGSVTWSKGPFMAMLKKVPWTGSNPAFASRVGNSPARSATFSVVKTKSEAANGITTVNQFVLDWYKDYGRATIDGLLLAVAGDKLGTFYDKFVAQLDGIMDATAHSFAVKSYRAGYGMIGNISTGTVIASTSLTLAIREDIVNFEKGMTLCLAATETGALRNAGATVTVTAINARTGTLTLSGNISAGIAAAAVGDFIFCEGDHATAGTTRTCVAGLDAWFPIVDPSGGENFFGVDRSTDTRQIGTVIDATSGMSEEEALINAVAETSRFAGTGAKKAFFNPTRYMNLMLQAQSRYRPTIVKGPNEITYTGSAVQTANGDIEVFSDPYCPRDKAYVLQMDTLQAYVAGGSTIPHFLASDGNKMLRQTDEDGVEARVGYYAAIGCDAPINNAVLRFV